MEDGRLGSLPRLGRMNRDTERSHCHKAPRLSSGTRLCGSCSPDTGASRGRTMPTSSESARLSCICSLRHSGFERKTGKATEWEERTRMEREECVLRGCYSSALSWSGIGACQTRCCASSYACRQLKNKVVTSLVRAPTISVTSYCVCITFHAVHCYCLLGSLKAGLASPTTLGLLTVGKGPACQPFTQGNAQGTQGV
eukprot:1092237-Rhodomonas_salina.1